MKFGVREICDVVFKAKQTTVLGGTTFRKGQPVLFIDSAKTSTVEGAATTVYATGGRGNNRLLAWEGEKTLTFTVEDALLSPIGFAILSGAGIFNQAKEGTKFQTHCTATETVDGKVITLTEAISSDAPIFVCLYEDGSVGDIIESVEVGEDGKTITLASEEYDGKQVFVDFYTEKTAAITELQIEAEKFGGFYYVEASTLFRRESDGHDLPAELVFPKVKIQSNFTFNMASTGDPSTFSFVMDAFPDYTLFNRSKKVLCAMQVIDEEASAATADAETVTSGAYDNSDTGINDSRSDA